MKAPFLCPSCHTGALVIARLQWSYSPLSFDPAAYVPEGDDESVVPMTRDRDEAFEEGDDELGELDCRHVECLDCGATFDEDDPVLLAHVRALAGVVDKNHMICDRLDVRSIPTAAPGD